MHFITACWFCVQKHIWTNIHTHTHTHTHNTDWQSDTHTHTHILKDSAFSYIKFLIFLFDCNNHNEAFVLIIDMWLWYDSVVCYFFSVTFVCTVRSAGDIFATEIIYLLTCISLWGSVVLVPSIGVGGVSVDSIVNGNLASVWRGLNKFRLSALEDQQPDFRSVAMARLRVVISLGRLLSVGFQQCLTGGQK